MNPKIVTVGKRHEYPVEFWGREDFAAEEVVPGDVGSKLLHGSPSQPRLGFRVHEPRVEGGVRSKGVDAWLDGHGFGSRGSRRAPR